MNVCEKHEMLTSTLNFFVLYIPIDVPTINEQMLNVTTDMGLCPRPSIRVRFGEVQSILGLTYKLSISSSVGCALMECPMVLSTEEKDLNFTLNDNVIYTVTLTVSNECGSDNITVTIQPEGEEIIMYISTYSPIVSHRLNLTVASVVVISLGCMVT